MLALSFQTAREVGGTVVRILFNPGALFSLPSLFSALTIAVMFLALRRARSSREVKIKGLGRALFPKSVMKSPTGRADILLAAFNILLFSAMFGPAIFSAPALSGLVNDRLVESFGPRPPAQLPAALAQALATAVLFIAYELGYWTNHYASHRIPMLWEFHRVHHTAERLSPLTNFRVHPIDSIVFGNFLALFGGLSGGVIDFALGGHTSAVTVAGTNLIFLGFCFVTVHLQHSHIWIPTRGGLGRLIMSPAHHQLHHSDDPRHHDCNYGSCLALWDWLFGTLVIPARRRPVLVFGAGPHQHSNHTIYGLMVEPFIASFGRLGIRWRIPSGKEHAAGASLTRSAGGVQS